MWRVSITDTVQGCYMAAYGGYMTDQGGCKSKGLLREMSTHLKKIRLNDHFLYFSHFSLLMTSRSVPQRRRDCGSYF